MHMFDSIAELSQHIGIPIAERTEHDPGGADRESDWAWRLRGPGRPAGADGGWLLTHAYGGPSRDGALIAYEIGDDNHKTGRCALLRQPWDEETDAREMRRLKESDVWTGLTSTNLIDIDSFLGRSS